MIWYCLAIRAQRYRKILEKLETLDIELYYPLRTVWRKQRSGPRVPKKYPLIPSYLFVGADLKRVSARSILSIDGVINFLGIDGVPSEVDADQLMFIRVCEEAGDYDQTLARIEQLLVGQSMAITEGAFASYSGVIKSISGANVELDITVFGRTTTVKISVDKLAKPL
jgi:transcription antitermination factor NusG